MSKKTISIYRFDCAVGLLVIYVAGACLLVAIEPVWPWNEKDSLGLGLFLFSVMGFLLLHRQAYAQTIPWLQLGFSALAVAALVVLFRRWSVVWAGAGAIILVVGLLRRSKTIAEGVPRDAVLRSALLITVSVVFTLTLVEGILRFFPSLLSEGGRLRVHWNRHFQKVDEKLYVYHPYIGHLANAKLKGRSARPGVKSVTVDNWGFRNTWPWPQQAEIIAVGDSMTYSQTVSDDQAWTALIDRALPQSRVLNFGLIGGSPQQYLRVYETFGVNLAPKVLLVGLFLGNDLWDARKFDLWWNAGGKGPFVEFGRKEVEPGILGWVARKLKSSYLIALLHDVRDTYRSGRLLQGQTLDLADGGRVQLVPSLLLQMANVGRAGNTEFNLVLEILERIQTLATKNRTHVVVLFFPSKEEVYLPIFGEPTPDLAVPFIPELDKRKIVYIDLGPPFRLRAAKGETLFWEIDGHPNPRGYALIGEVVLTHLKENARRYGLKNAEELSSQKEAGASKGFNTRVTSTINSQP